MTVQNPTPNPAPATPNMPPTPVEFLRECMEKASRKADDLGELAGREREAAKERLTMAAGYIDAAMVVRAQAETWKRLMEGAIAEAENEQRAVQAQRAEAARHPLVMRVQPHGQPMVLCSGCLNPIRYATGEEQAAAQAGLGRRNTQRDCPNCGIEAAAQRVETATT